MSRFQNFVWTLRMKTLVEMNWLDFDVGLWCHHGLNPGLRMWTITSHSFTYGIPYGAVSHIKSFIEIMHLIYDLSRSLMCNFIISWVICEHTSTAGCLVPYEVNRCWSWFCCDFDRGGVEVFFGQFYVFCMCIISPLVYLVQ